LVAVGPDPRSAGGFAVPLRLSRSSYPMVPRPTARTRGVTGSVSSAGIRPGTFPPVPATGATRASRPPLWDPLAAPGRGPGRIPPFPPWGPRRMSSPRAQASPRSPPPSVRSAGTSALVADGTCGCAAPARHHADPGPRVTASGREGPNDDGGW